MTTPEQILAAYADAKNRHDVDDILRVCHPDCFYQNIGSPDRIQGAPALRQFYTALFRAIPDYRGDFDGRAFLNDTALAWGRFGGTVKGDLLGIPASGRRIEIPVVFLCTFKDGLISSDTGYFDMATLLAQAGRPVTAAGDAPAGPVIKAAIHREFARKFAQAWSDPTPERLGELVHLDTQNVYPFTDGKPLDRAGVIAHFRRMLQAVPDLRIEVVRWASNEDIIMIEWAAKATVGGQPMQWQGVDSFTLRGEQARQECTYFDTHMLREVLAHANAAPQGERRTQNAAR